MGNSTTSRGMPFYPASATPNNNEGEIRKLLLSYLLYAQLHTTKSTKIAKCLTKRKKKFNDLRHCGMQTHVHFLHNFHPNPHSLVIIALNSFIAICVGVFIAAKYSIYANCLGNLWSGTLLSMLQEFFRPFRALLPQRLKTKDGFFVIYYTQRALKLSFFTRREAGG